MPKGRGRGRGGGASAAVGSGASSGASRMSKDLREDLGLSTPAKEGATLATSPTTTIPAPPPPEPAVETNEPRKPKPKGGKKRKPVPQSFLPDTPVTSRTNSVSTELAGEEERGNAATASEAAAAAPEVAAAAPEATACRGPASQKSARCGRLAVAKICSSHCPGSIAPACVS